MGRVRCAVSHTAFVKQRMVLNPDPQAWIAKVLETLPMRESAVTYEVAQETARVQLPHRDPPDRFLVATARVGGLTLVTSDKTLIKAKPVAILANPLAALTAVVSRFLRLFWYGEIVDAPGHRPARPVPALCAGHGIGLARQCWRLQACLLCRPV